MFVKPPDGSAAPDAARVAEEHGRLLADESIQFDLPQYQPPEPPGWLKRFGEWLSARSPEPGDEPGWLSSLFNSLEGVAPGLGTLFYVVLGLLVATALFFLVRFLLRRSWRRPDAEEDLDLRPDAATARGLLGEADALAARGLFSDAVHLLLFRSIEDLDSRRPELVRPAFTSRDIAALEPIPAGPRSAFHRIAMSVERSLFAQRPLAEGDWRDCRAAYEQFAFAEGWQG